jgi:hypothetical protein
MFKFEYVFKLSQHTMDNLLNYVDTNNTTGFPFRDNKGVVLIRISMRK